MIYFWDSSAVINAMLSKSVFKKLDTDQHFIRYHVLFEVFSTFTGRGIPVTDALGQKERVTMLPSEVADWLRIFAKRVQFLELTTEETLTGLDDAERLRVMGGRVYDYGHALAAKKVKADVILTRNPDDFKGLTGKTKVEWP
jgi:hypothetical protein